MLFTTLGNLEAVKVTYTCSLKNQGQKQNKASVVTVIRNGDRVDRENSAYFQNYFSCF